MQNLSYQEILNDVTNDTVNFIKEEVSKFNIDAAIVMELINKVTLEINYHSTLSTLTRQRDLNEHLIERDKQHSQSVTSEEVIED